MTTANTDHQATIKTHTVGDIEMHYYACSCGYEGPKYRDLDNVRFVMEAHYLEEHARRRAGLPPLVESQADAMRLVARRP